MLDRVRKVYGPPEGLPVVRSSVQVDLDGDGEEEVVVLFFDPDIAPDVPLTAALLSDGLTCSGFAALTEVEGVWFPVFYRFNDYRMSLHLGVVDGLELADEQLICDSYGQRSVLGWSHYLGHVTDHPPAWRSMWRTWDTEQDASSPIWRAGSFFQSIVGK